MSVNRVTEELPPYLMESLATIRRDLIQRKIPVYDFGTGDPKIPTWPPIKDALVKALPKISQYPSIKPMAELDEAIWGYLDRRFGLKRSNDLMISMANGSKESVFHIALSLIGRAGGRKHLLYPNPGYPVYQTSALFAGGIPYPVTISADNGFLLEPWQLPRNVQKDAAAIWLNYPHNPTGAEASRRYWEKVIDWAHENDVVILSDDCYIDIYDPEVDVAMAKDPSKDLRPINPLTIATKNILSFMSLSKRSGMTGYRSGFTVGDREIMAQVEKARANFGVATPLFVQAAAAVAWRDDVHVAERRQIFSRRMKLAAKTLQELNMLDVIPSSTFYLWCRIPEQWGDDDIGFCLKLAERGVITSASQWLSEGVRGYMRFALVPEEDDIEKAMAIVREFVQSERS